MRVTLANEINGNRDGGRMRGDWLAVHAVVAGVNGTNLGPKEALSAVTS